MRTDSNTVLPLSSGVSPTKSSLVKAPSTNGEAFANDFNKAKEALDPSKTSTAGESSTPTVSSSASLPTSSTSTIKVSDSSDVSINSKTKGDVLPSELSGSASNVVATVTNSIEGSGNILQDDGEIKPSNSLAAVPAEENSDLLSVTASPDFKNTENQPSTPTSPDGDANQILSGVAATPQRKFMSDGVTSSQEELVSGGVTATPQRKFMPDGVTSSELQRGSIDSVMVPETELGAMAPVVSTGAVGLDAIKRNVSNNVSKVDLLPKPEMLPESDSGSVELLDANGEGELSWVMSQMASSGTKATPISAIAGDGVVLDAAKVTTVAAGVAGVINKNGRSDVPPLILSESALAASGSSEMKMDAADSLLGEDGVLINEPIELRKKEQEVMLGRMSAQIDGAAGDVGGGLNSSLHNNVNRSAGMAAVISNNPVPNAQTNLTMNLPPSHPGWASEMSQKVAWVARDGGHTAHIRLDPPELGSLTVKVSVDSDSNTQVSFVAATPQARDLLEGQMGRLREMLAQQGMDLSRADVDVSQQDTSNAQDRDNNQNNTANQNNIVDSDDELIANNVSYVSASGVDYYA
ncbi:flagellar hook-length control protein FliK [Marinomonas sp. RSW2]|uniref:Flagellar hook-length control protein FliK n=1 Tax=Marinomonas maritima TaxID=2940935 RepID=A0ABT5WFZ2_9GAMM|nr:flagellar hook-length control protein FliK [Marinomonas maritima]MDE8603748.1 flagellar hook-length control protein FliK [Marinomonas maritima]